MRVLIAAALVAAFSLPAQAGPKCMPEEAMRAFLAAKYQEKPIAGGLSNRGSMVRVFVGPGGSWSIVITTPRGISCIVDAGEAWREIEAARHGPQT